MNSELLYPKEPFEEFYNRFETVREMKQHEDWNNIYSKFYELTPRELTIPIGETTDNLNNFSAQQQIEEIVKCAQDFFYWCHRYVKILNPKFGTIPFVPYKYQRRVIKEYEEKRFNIVSKFRQGGLTTIAALWSFWRCMFQKDQQIYFLSITDREALTAGDITQKALDNFPYWMFDHSQSEMTKHEKKFNDLGSKLCFYTPEAARGKSATHIIVDEAAFIEKMHDHWKAMYPVIAAGGRVEIISTVNGLGNWYEETYHEAEAGRNFFNVIQLDYLEHPGYANPEWAKETKANLGEKGWRQEVLRDFLGSGETFISANIIQQIDKSVRQTPVTRTAFQKWTNEDQIKQNLDDGALWIWKEPMEGHEYTIGADCAEGVGREGDNSCFQVIDNINLEQVAEFYSQTVPPHIFAQILNQVGNYYNQANLVVENNTIGGAVLNLLTNDLAYESLYYDATKKTGGPGIKIGSSNRPILLESLQQRLTNGSMKINSKRLTGELNTFVYNVQKKRPEATKGKHDDAIMALSLALYAREERIRGLPIGEDNSEMMKMMKNNASEEIKQELLEGGKKDWMADVNFQAFSIGQPESEQKRPSDSLLREFGWMINWLFLGGTLLYNLI